MSQTQKDWWTKIGAIAACALVLPMIGTLIVFGVTLWQMPQRLERDENDLRSIKKDIHIIANKSGINLPEDERPSGDFQSYPDKTDDKIAIKNQPQN